MSGLRPISAAELQALADKPGNGSSVRDDAPVELKSTGLPQRDALLEIADKARLWRTSDGETFATIWRDGHVEHHAIASRGFRDWWIVEFGRRFLSNGRPASVGQNSIRDATNGLEARAYAEGIKQEAPLRNVQASGGVYIDTGWDDWSAIEISSDGWEIVRSPPVPIVRSRRTAALPMPADEANFASLRNLLGRIDDDDFILLVAWCLAALWPTGPYPILIFGGEQGSGKSTLARLVQRISDPVTGDLLQPPANDRDLIAAARHGRVLAFDNVSSIRPDLADSICRLATGAEIGGRALFTDHDTASFKACRPIILNGIPDLAARGDLADRSIVIKLAPLSERLTEREFWSEIETAMPVIMAALLDALVVGYRRLDEVRTPSVRMADFARLIVAAEPALPWQPGAFLAAYQRNRQRITTTLVEGDLVATRVAKFVRRNDKWSGLVSELYDLLTDELQPEQRRAGDWPGNARWFSDRLTRAAPALRNIGIEIIKKVISAGTSVSVRQIAPLAPLEPQTAE